jgi:hypothetical protein
MTEEWKTIEGTNSKYKISNFGNAIGVNGKKLKPTLMKIGYLSIAISLGNRKVIRYYVHKLVAENFIGTIPAGSVVNHKDHNKLNNNVENLEIISRKDNGRHWALTNRSTEAGRKRTGFCGRGHKLIGERVYCLECRKLSNFSTEKKPPNDKIWRESIVPEYLISNDGLVWSTKTNRIIKASKNIPGYLYVNLRISGKTKPYAIHRLVAEAFIGSIPKDMVVDHINSNKADNTVGNLRIISRISNSIFSRKKIRKDGKNGYAIDEKIASQIKWLLLNTNMIQRDIANFYGVSYSMISAIKNGHSWSHVNEIKPINIEEILVK